MLNGLYSAAAGMAAQQTRIDALSNDIANVNTAGYKQVRVGFRDLVYTHRRPASRSAPAPLPSTPAASLGQGGLQQNGDPLSVAIDGPGFFQVKRGDGSLALTRYGDFHARRERPARHVRAASGSWPPITLPAGTNADDVAISPTARHRQADVDRHDPGRDVPAPSGLQPVGGSLFRPDRRERRSRGRRRPRASARASLEASNVDLATALTDMMDAQRSFQIASQGDPDAGPAACEIANGIRR